MEPWRKLWLSESCTMHNKSEDISCSLSVDSSLDLAEARPSGTHRSVAGQPPSSLDACLLACALKDLQLQPPANLA